jgi:hypothetical protein
MNTTQDHDRTISIDCEEFRHCLQMKIKALAAKRCREMLHDRIKKEGNL